MIGRFNEPVVHMPTSRLGKIVMHPSGSIGISSTAVQFDGGPIEELPDSDLRVALDDGGLKITGMRFASKRPIPGGMTVQLKNNGDGTVTITGQIPGKSAVTVHNLAIQDGEVALPDELFFPISR